MVKVLFICLGNICRSPMAHGSFRDLIRDRGLGQRVEVDSCGTSAYHAGEPPDSNMIQVAARHGVEISDLVSRQLVRDDYFDFDLLVAMDRSNFHDALSGKPSDSPGELVRFMDFVPGAESSDVPDPWWGGQLEGFEKVYRIISEGLDGVLERALALEAEQTQ